MPRFRHRERYKVEDRNDRNASHRLNIALADGAGGRIRMRFDEPYTAAAGTYDVVIRYFDEKEMRSRFVLHIGGAGPNSEWESAGEGGGWMSQTIHGIRIKIGDEIRVDSKSSIGRLDYVQLNLQDGLNPN